MSYKKLKYIFFLVVLANYFHGYSQFVGGDSFLVSNERFGDTCNFVAFMPFAGGDADGFSNQRFGDTCNFMFFTPFAGGDADGFSNQRFGDTCNFIAFTPFAGGSNGGSSGFSFLIVDAVTCEAMTPLPIQLLYFDAVKEGDDRVRTEWVTMSERNNDYFTVERSTDGLNWADIGEVQGAGNSSSKLEYFWYDMHPESGISYYRLKQTDFDGKFTHSGIKSVFFDDNSNAVITLHPNPTNGKTEMNVIGKSLENAILKIYTSAGQIIYQFDNFSGATHSFDLSPFTPGVYLLKVASQEGVKVFKIVKK